MTVKKTESKIFLIDAKLRLTSKACKIGLGCNAWWEGFSKSSWPVEVVTVVLKSDVFFDPLRLVFFGKNCENCTGLFFYSSRLIHFRERREIFEKVVCCYSSAILCNAATYMCMYHEVYQQLAVIFVVTRKIYKSRTCVKYTRLHNVAHVRTAFLAIRHRQEPWHRLIGTKTYRS